MKGNQSLIERVTGVLKLDVATFEEVEHDESATGQAALVVVVIAILVGIGAGFAGDTGFDLNGLIGAILGAIIGWIAWSFVVYFVGTKFFGGTADAGEMLRVIGFAQAPNAIRVLAFIPVLGRVIGFIALIWALLTGVVGVRQGLDVSTGTAVIVMIIGAIAYLIIDLILSLILGVSGMGLALLF